MGLMMLVWVVVLTVLVLVVVKLTSRQLPPGAQPEQDRRLAEQAEEIEGLRDELRRVQEQADFTEKLLTERSEAQDEEKPDSGGGS